MLEEYARLPGVVAATSERLGSFEQAHERFVSAITLMTDRVTKIEEDVVVQLAEEAERLRDEVQYTFKLSAQAQDDLDGDIQRTINRVHKLETEGANNADKKDGCSAAQTSDSVRDFPPPSPRERKCSLKHLSK
jgi:hypothetical protein